MKKVFALLAVAAMFAVACSKDDDNKKDEEQKPDPKPADEYAGPVEGTSDWSVIGQLAEEKVAMNWDGDLVMAASGDNFVLKDLKITATDEFKIRFQKGWDNNRGGAFEKLGEGFEVTNGGDNIKPAYAGLVDVWYNPAKEQMAVCEAGKAPTWKEGAGLQPSGAITIDGDFADWAELDPTAVVGAVCDDYAPWEGVSEIRVYAADDHVYYYIRFDKESLDDAFELVPNDMHIRLCINTDGEFESGYASYFLQAYDFIVEGSIATEGAFIDFDGTLHQRFGSWTPLLEPGYNLVAGKGAGVEYEIVLDRSIFNQAAALSSDPKPMGDVFQTGIRFYFNGWQEFSNMPNADIDDDGTGWGDLLEVSF